MLLFHLHQEALWILFAFCHQGGVICISVVMDISPRNTEPSLHCIQHSILHGITCIEVEKAKWQHTTLNYSFPNVEPVHSSMPSSNCCILTCIQVSHEAGELVCYSCLFKNFPQFGMIHMVKGFSIVNETEVEVFLEFFSILEQLEISRTFLLPVKNSHP